VAIPGLRDLEARAGRLTPLLLRGIEQQSHQTVALLLDLTPQAVSMRFTRALDRLREQLPGSIFDELDAGA
jgi:DNA-directed RNA polymerase specialized sigma24 family protein